MKRYIAVTDQITWSRREFASVTGRSLEVIDRWLSEGIPCCRDGKNYIFERTSAVEWLRKRAISRTGMKTKKSVCEEVFPGVELS
jgi:phage terminase Nu1 subunit (DNA packaging protein)